MYNQRDDFAAVGTSDMSILKLTKKPASGIAPA